MIRMLVASCVLCAAIQRAGAAESLVVHEWGTFTSFQDENGVAIGGINVDDEPVPPFVHDAAPGLLTALNDTFPSLSKGFPTGDPSVTMRLETPILYFHPAQTQSAVTADVRVDFHGGWLTQFFPNATATRPGHQVNNGFSFDPLTVDRVSTLHWSSVDIVSHDVTAPVTVAPVWLAPRKVKAANIQVGKESERFLFYRGVGHVDAPVRVRRDDQGMLTIQATAGSGDIQRYLLVDIRPDGQVAFRIITGQSAATIDAGSERFAETDYSRAHLEDLRREMHLDLTHCGLFDDEALALLNTWEASYFRSPGLRVFFLVPRPWVDRILPIAVVPRAAIERAMIGRIELISPSQRAALATISASPRSTTWWWDDFLNKRIYTQSADGKGSFQPGGQSLLKSVMTQPGTLARYQVAVPDDYAAYLAMGRFRAALIRWRTKPHGDPALRAFAETYGLETFTEPKRTNSGIFDMPTGPSLPH